MMGKRPHLPRREVVEMTYATYPPYLPPPIRRGPNHAKEASRFPRWVWIAVAVAVVVIVAAGIVLWLDHRKSEDNPWNTALQKLEPFRSKAAPQKPDTAATNSGHPGPTM